MPSSGSLHNTKRKSNVEEMDVMAEFKFSRCTDCYTNQHGYFCRSRSSIPKIFSRNYFLHSSKQHGGVVHWMDSWFNKRFRWIFLEWPHYNGFSHLHFPVIQYAKRTAVSWLISLSWMCGQLVKQNVYFSMLAGKSRPNRHQHCYRQLQILHCAVTSKLREWIAGSYYFIVFFTITISYTIIKHAGALGKFLLLMFIAVDVTVTLISVFICQSSVNSRQDSVSYLLHTDLRHYYSISKLDVAFFKSCRPIEIKVGGMFTIADGDFCLHTYVSVILEQTIGLTLSF